MTELFLRLVNMSISAGWLVLAVLIFRLILKKAPKWVNVLLWGIVAVRLICPFSIESALSLIPSRETISPEIMMDWTPEISTGIESLDQVVNPVISTSFAPKPWASANPLQILIPVWANIWFLGVLVMLTYTAISYISLRCKLRTAVILRDNIFQCETVNSPFVLGILRPRIYLPYTMDGKNLDHVVAHEQAHIRRKDHWWKPLGFLLLTIHWFNPLMWVAYILLCRDIELACDEKVIAELGNEQRADYTQALVACAVNRRMIAACPLAFGEVGVKERVKSIMNYRKPTFWIIVIALVVCAVVAVCFLTDPNPSREFSMSGYNVSSLNPEAIVDRILDIENIDNSGVYTNSMNFSLQVDPNFNWADSQAVSYFYKKSKTTYKGQLRISPNENKYFLTEPSEGQEQRSIFLLRHYLEAIKYLPQEAIQEMAPADQYIVQQREEGRPADYDRVITYSSEGVEDTDGWYIHLQIQPLHEDGEAYSGTGDEVLDVFYGESYGSTATPDNIAFGIYDLEGENTRITEVRLRNLHNGKDTVITDPTAIESIADFFSKVQGANRTSSKGYYGGSYQVQLFNGSRTVFSIGFGDDESFNYGDYGDGYPTRYELRGVTREEIIRFFSQFDSSGFDWGLFDNNGFNYDKIVISHSDESNVVAEITAENQSAMSEILSMYQSLQVEEYGRPLSGERMVIQFFKGEDIVQEWTVSYYEEDDTIVTCSDGFGLGNRRVTSDFSYDRLLRLFEEHAYTIILCYEPLGVSGDNVKELSTISDHVKWRDGLGFEELAPGKEAVSDFEIEVEEDGSDLILTLTWARQPLVLKYGIRAKDGTEYFQEKPGGYSHLRIEDIPAGTYHLFVKNSDAYHGIPAYENPEDFPDVSFNATGAILYSFDN